MAITAYTGPPGSGKSHALVKQVVLSAVLAGRRVVSNIDGLNPNAVLAYCLERPNLWKVDRPDQLGQIVLFHGEDAQAPGFWPTEATEREGVVTFVRPGDLVVFDEWAMFFQQGVKTDATQAVEDFMRWHRHLTSPEGHATDLAIATQSISDFHRRHRPLISTSYLFKKLTAIGAKDAYTWHAYQGRLQKTPFLTGTDKYDPQVFPLYQSSAAASSGNHTELRTDANESIWSSGKAWMAIVAPVVLLGGGGFALYRVISQYNNDTAATPANSPRAKNDTPPPAAPTSPVPSSKWRIAGVISSPEGAFVVLSATDGETQMAPAYEFRFHNGRPISGYFAGEYVTARDGLQSAPSGFGIPGASPFGGNYK